MPCDPTSYVPAGSPGRQGIATKVETDCALDVLGDVLFDCEFGHGLLGCMVFVLAKDADFVYPVSKGAPKRTNFDCLCLHVLGLSCRDRIGVGVSYDTQSQGLGGGSVMGYCVAPYQQI